MIFAPAGADIRRIKDKKAGLLLSSSPALR
jgi:hypothetical protein